jgi:glycerophosphoryl diester phosphodiesterase family protein
MTLRRIIVVLSVVLLFVLVAASPRIWDEVQLRTGWALPNRTGSPLLIVSHHGDLDAYPENTLESFVAAAALGPDGIELDVHQAASGTWYVIHDPTLDRTTDGHGSVASLSDQAIDAAVIDGGLGYRSTIGAHLHVPRLAEVLDALEAYKGIIYLDLQHAESGDAATLLDLTNGLRVTIICRSAADAAAVKSRDDAVETLVSLSIPATSAVDGLIGDASLHASPRLMSGWTRPLTVYVEESQFDQDEYALLRVAWASGVRAFITNHLKEALAMRDGFIANPP